MNVQIRHVRAADLCMKGARKWFAGRGLDWNTFITEGLPADFLRELNDPFADRALRQADLETGETKP